MAAQRRPSLIVLREHKEPKSSPDLSKQTNCSNKKRNELKRQQRDKSYCGE